MMHMTYPALTAAYAAWLALVFVALSAWVVAGRVKGNVLHGDGGQDGLNRRIRAHGNFAEFVPLALLLCALLEARGAGPGLMHALLAPLLVARIAHPFGMTAAENTPRQYLGRGLAAVVTLLVLPAAAVALLLR
jgi:uncharacterized membrane protein YecN with MAPEG domain